MVQILELVQRIVGHGVKEEDFLFLLLLSRLEHFNILLMYLIIYITIDRHIIF